MIYDFFGKWDLILHQTSARGKASCSIIPQRDKTASSLNVSPCLLQNGQVGFLKDLGVLGNSYWIILGTGCMGL